MRTAVPLMAILLGISAAPAESHFNMLLPQTAATKRGESVTITYQWGHPFEHQLFDAPQPQSLIVRAPDGKRTEMTDKLQKSARKVGAKDTTVYELRFTPEERGDYIFLLRTPPIWMEEDGEFLQDTVKVVLHVQMQKGWNSTQEDFAFDPLTRPYGLLPGMVFQARLPAATGEAARELSLVEIERYNAAPPSMVPADELITRTVQLDPTGVATTTLTEPGWWSLTIARPSGTRMHAGKPYPLRQRATLWVHVDESAARK